MKDVNALEAAKRSFAAYAGQGTPAATGDKRMIFLFSHQPKDIHAQVEPLAMLKDGRPMLIDYWNPDTPYDHEARGAFLNVYKSGRMVGRAVTESQHDRRVMWGAASLVRFIPENKGTLPPRFALATNFPLKSRSTESASLTEKQKKILVAMAEKWTASSDMPPEEKKRFLRDARVVMASGALSSDGRRFLVGTWQVGSAGDAHYGGYFAASLFLIAEQQPDGSFAPGSLETSGCLYADHADLDSDGTDELVLACEAVEGEGTHTIFKRKDGQWTFAESVLKE